ncbi:hypothetical protein Ahy_A04g020012 isoform A [Arachis hypogaea]|uniref:Small EDRK-rich factor-like N-terminal domain-containing protein n=1 Tax=Arachis hypogaea TaxID=3818 RepID=A0A445DGX6_ARAHY|nr:hypothetical protein Ahy_A04g020012 isoform A [Arachis hypogaea]
MSLRNTESADVHPFFSPLSTSLRSPPVIVISLDFSIRKKTSGTQYQNFKSFLYGTWFPFLQSNHVLREKDRERAQARAGSKAKQGKSDGLTPEQRRERDAKALQEKAAKKAAGQDAGGNNAGGSGNKK